MNWTLSHLQSHSRKLHKDFLADGTGGANAMMYWDSVAFQQLAFGQLVLNLSESMLYWISGVQSGYGTGLINSD